MQARTVGLWRAQGGHAHTCLEVVQALEALLPMTWFALHMLRAQKLAGMKCTAFS